MHAVQDVGNPTKEAQPSNAQLLRSSRAPDAAHTAGVPVMRFDAPGPRTLNGVQPRDHVGVRLGIGVWVGCGGFIGDSEKRIQGLVKSGGIFSS